MVTNLTQNHFVDPGKDRIVDRPEQRLDSIGAEGGGRTLTGTSPKGF